MTSTNPERVRAVGGPEHHVHEIVGKPYDMQIFIGAVKCARIRP